jgi:mono/diheme cytochrome c family protein
MSNQDIPPPPPGEDSPSQPLSNPVESELSTLDIHHALMREASDPNEAFDPGPRWFYVFAVVALIVGGFYLGMHMGAFSTQTHIGFLPPGVPLGAQTATTQIGKKQQMSGAAVYNSKCSSCHQANGQGMPGAFPPLADSPYVIDDPAIPVKIVLRGMQGPIEVKGTTYNGMMPAWADLLTDEEIAAVVSHIRSELGGNSAEPVDTAFVAGLRQETANHPTPWTAEELTGARQ